jgi:hypothetical protein
MSDASGPAADPGYLLDNAQAQARGRFAGLEASFDTLTQGHLAARGCGQDGGAWRWEPAAAR